MVDSAGMMIVGSAAVVTGGESLPRPDTGIEQVVTRLNRESSYQGVMYLRDRESG